MNVKYVVEHHRLDVRIDIDEPIVTETYDHPAHIPYNRPEYRMAIMLEDFEGSHIKFVPGGKTGQPMVKVFREKVPDNEPF